MRLTVGTSARATHLPVTPAAAAGSGVQFAPGCAKLAARMWLDVEEIGRFYETPLGRVARRLIRRRIREIWPTAKGENIKAMVEAVKDYFT